MQLIKITHTDQWQGDPTFVGLASGIDEAVDLARQAKDAMKDVASGNGHIVFDWVTVGELDSEERIGATDSDVFKAMLSFETPEGWKKCEAYGCFYRIQDGTIESVPQSQNVNFITSEEFDEDEIIEVSIDAFSEEEEFPFVVEIQVLFDLESDEVMKLSPIDQFSHATAERHAAEY